MGMILIYSLIFLLIILIFGLGLFIYSRKKKSKVGLIISVLIIAFVISALLINVIDEFTISKKDITSDLKYINIELNDDFEIAKNSVSGMPERLQETEIIITQNDKEKIISEIKNSANFKLITNIQEIATDTNSTQMEISGKVLNFKYPEFYSKKTYLISDHIRIYAQIYDNKNTLTYNKIQD